MHSWSLVQADLGSDCHGAVDEIGSVCHDETLGRKDAVHLLRRAALLPLVHSWLLEQKLEDDLTPVEPYRTRTSDEFVAELPAVPEVERRAAGRAADSHQHVQEPPALSKIVEVNDPMPGPPLAYGAGWYSLVEYGRADIFDGDVKFLNDGITDGQPEVGYRSDSEVVSSDKC